MKQLNQMCFTIHTVAYYYHCLHSIITINHQNCWTMIATIASRSNSETNRFECIEYSRQRW